MATHLKDKKSHTSIATEATKMLKQEDFESEAVCTL